MKTTLIRYDSMGADGLYGAKRASGHGVLSRDAYTTFAAETAPNMSLTRAVPDAGQMG